MYSLKFSETLKLLPLHIECLKQQTLKKSDTDPKMVNLLQGFNVSKL